ncbi:putative mitochondrial cyclophilin 14, putative (CYP14) [Leptomonas pyrrhocoris]|uniref:Putative mitochondrial cyclophilin 14, putative (CYP14) n=1 Tax=Leptomonas pyrrhocoris TaxID=157538 RepID=A0A0M9GAF3_LEPPY|nr:putative mitochondrial cyclophilin 14, putative (CYP14) [Leptomonas pyrrhocoris]KPA86089.1 putative mitochondrial cyclophilin 14, putative (CYP14) [Leptomonas pyrrhocoris]|eukprot:XP_015664528.1 putative mitochondrial cyclophilin 14, putative (CYP14) [Leptomonas pyrrhocoris]
MVRCTVFRVSRPFAAPHVRGFCTVTAPRLFAGLHASPLHLDSSNSNNGNTTNAPRHPNNASAGSTESVNAIGKGSEQDVRHTTAADDDVTVVNKDYSEETHQSTDDGFHEDAIIVRDAKGNSLTRIRRLPLTLVEEVPLPQRILTDLELIMMAWCEEHARQYAIFMSFVRISIFVLLFIILYVFYKTTLSSERVLRGVDKMPADLRIGNVVYFDVTENGMDIGRIVIGLLNEDCPLYCEYFHRRCTGNGGKGESFRGMSLAAIVPRHCLIFGDGHEMEHDVPGFNSHYLPTEHLSGGAWRGALSAIAYGPNRESPNFSIHISSGDYRPQVFAIVIGGYNVIERMNQAGSKHGNSPKKHYVIESCGELCTLAKSHIAPMPWKLYESVSVGYDEEKFGPRLSPDVLRHSDELGAAAFAKLHNAAEAATATPEKKKKRWGIF